MKNRYKKLLTLAVLLLALLMVFTDGYLKWLTGYIFLWFIQSYVAWFLYFKCNQPFVGFSVTMGIGAYGTIVLTTMYNWPNFLAMLVSIIVSAILAILIFMSTSRAKGFYITMVSFLLAILFPKFIEAMREITGGRSGLYFSGLDIGENTFYVIIILLTVIILGFFVWLMNTNIGKIFTLISENDELTQAVGINTFKYKILAYSIAGFISALGGALYVNYTGFISSIDINVFTTVYITFMPIIGGSKVFYGPILGTLFIRLLPEFLITVERYLDIIFGLSFFLVMLLLPDGFGPNLEKLITKFTGNNNQAKI